MTEYSSFIHRRSIPYALSGLIIIYSAAFTLSQGRTDELDAYKNSISLICTSPLHGPNVIEQTLGTGITFSYGGRIWVLSSRHVVEPEIGKAKIKSLLRIKDSGETPYVNLVFNFGNAENVRFHPDDTSVETRDIALFSFDPVEKISRKLQVFELPLDGAFPKLRGGEELIILGYPKKDLSYEEITQRDTALPLKVISAKFMPHVSDSRPVNYGKKGIQQNRAIIEESEDLDGMSGGLVLVRTETHIVPIGMLTGSGRGRLIDIGGLDSVNINFVSFVHLKYVHDILRQFR